MNYKAALDVFVQSGKDFAIVYRSAKQAASVSRILVLDSSFNPPHMAHFTLAKEAIDHDFGDARAHPELSELPKMLLLLLSVKNADKVVPKPALFDHRLAMMHRMASSLESLELPVAIGLTKHAKFADKSAAIQAHCSVEPQANYASARLTFLLGFDTLIRVLDPKYYAPASLVDSLNDFMYNTDLFCLTRADTGEEFDQQQNYIGRIARGEFPDIPRLWARNIILTSVQTARESIGFISSSAIRQAYATGAVAQSPPLLKEVDEYIRSNDLYSEDTT
ncbi:Nucleotidylyl transferase [Metschnikowia bicuspidata var. bicuspidata NRRL YB-4993]|uniref:Nucleotidylyl transferase n=1 Tax=Metschnikowia bicuspidata var. bicuspidata NRRL YB-4993 TaxID=869754 RepID=A0A1A0H251_9ASCO|nr:Nucleotidylyl transferase [Metschnikowia bicuspidata var. bicuspidata NRRL YB-4993]OBA18030.1 Nucleotidylyl transferase [Metschnikowia bicuspidata var. bicuspidata NRRL YB-4993]